MHRVEAVRQAVDAPEPVAYEQREEVYLQKRDEVVVVYQEVLIPHEQTGDPHELQELQQAEYAQELEHLQHVPFQVRLLTPAPGGVERASDRAVDNSRDEVDGQTRDGVEAEPPSEVPLRDRFPVVDQHDSIPLQVQPETGHEVDVEVGDEAGVQRRDLLGVSVQRGVVLQRRHDFHRHGRILDLVVAAPVLELVLRLPRPGDVRCLIFVHLARSSVVLHRGHSFVHAHDDVAVHHGRLGRAPRVRRRGRRRGRFVNFAFVLGESDSRLSRPRRKRAPGGVVAHDAAVLGATSRRATALDNRAGRSRALDSVASCG
eukprot:31323-Pelagococcus_subviridis.AAC.26